MAVPMRMPGKHPAPLKTLNRGNTFLHHRTPSSAKRKSAVELLQESKAFYVKSETVLDRQQQLKHSGHLQVTSSPVDTVFLKAPRYLPQQIPPPLPPKSPRLVAPPQRRAAAQPSDQLQTKLRRLLNADSKENLQRIWCDEQKTDNKLIIIDRKDTITYRTPGQRNSIEEPSVVRRDQKALACGNSCCSVHHKSLPDLHTRSRLSSSSSSDSQSPRCCRRSISSARSAASSGGRFNKPRTSNSSRSVRTAPRSSSPLDLVEPILPIKPPKEYSEDACDDPVDTPSSITTSSESSSSARSGSATNYHSLLRRGCSDNSWHEQKRRPILRSKSDISHRYWRNGQTRLPPPPPEPRSTEQLERFFEQLGLENAEYRSISMPSSGSSSPVFFESVSSVDSMIGWGPDGANTSGNIQRPLEQPSIIERNARIIKWLCNCRKAQLTSLPPS